MAKTKPNPAQHLQWQQHGNGWWFAILSQKQSAQSNKCRHVQSSSYSWLLLLSWNRVAWLLAALCLLTRPVMPEVIYRVDPLALLAATLRTYQRAGCDSEQLSLSCPRGTSISIELAQYGRAGDLSDHSLCPPVSQEDLTTTGSAGDAVIHSGTEIEVKPPETCTVSGLQYALLQTVVDACQKKRHCKFAANSKTHTAGDPCSGIRKFVEIAYKCRPYEFRSKVACENDNMPLMCNPYSRIAIYSASFGHTERESVQCGGSGAGGSAVGGHGATSGGVVINREESGQPTCLVSYATETVMQICHGRRRCSVTADAGTFGRPCKTDVRMYLKVVYTCIPRKVLKDRYETAAEMDEPQQTDLDLDQDELYDEDQFYKESEAIPPAPKLQGANVGRSFDFDVNAAGGEEATSTLLPPLLSRNDGSLEERLRSSIRLVNRIKESFNHQLVATTLTNEHIITTTTIAATTDIDDDNNDNDIKFETEVTDTPIEVTESTNADNNHDNNNNDDDDDNDNDDTTSYNIGNFFNRRKCQMVDDWGPIGLNCTDEDIVTERVEVVGFLANWLNTYLYIRKHQEQFYLYLIISVTAGVLLCLTLVIGRLTLQRRSGGRKKRNSSVSGVAKGFADTQLDGSAAGGTGGGGGSGAAGGGSGNFQQLTTGETHLTDSFGDDISDIDVDVDLTTPVPLSSLSSRNETYMTYAPTPNCNYGGLPSTQLHHPSSTATSVLMAPSSQANIYTSMGHPVVSGAMTIGPHMLGPSNLSGISPAYLSGTIMVPGHQHTHAGTLRRTLIPTSMGMMSTASPPPGAGMGMGMGMGMGSGAGMGLGMGVGPSPGGGNSGMAMPPHSMASNSGSGVYYDSTVPRSLARGLSTESSGQYFYG